MKQQLTAEQVNESIDFLEVHFNANHSRQHSVQSEAAFSYIFNGIIVVKNSFGKRNITVYDVKLYFWCIYLFL